MTNRHFQPAIGVPSGPRGALWATAIRATRAYGLLLAFALLIGAGMGGTTPAQAESGVPADPQVVITCPATGCFADVHPNDPSYDYANRLYIQGVVSGYPCGGPGEPCDQYNRPYYRPGVTVTRQQMAKFEDQGRRQPGIYIATSDYPFAPIFVNTTANNQQAIHGESNAGSNAVGVYGSSATGYGIYGASGANGGTGIYGIANNGINAVGVQGFSSSNTGVMGSSAAVSGEGVFGTSAGTNGKGISGLALGSGGWGVYGESNNGSAARGVYGYSNSGYGVYGTSAATNSYGVVGEANTGGSGAGVYGTSTTANGVRGLTTSANDTNAGVVGESTAQNGTGVKGIANNGTSAWGVWGDSNSGYGVYGSSDTGYGVYGGSTDNAGVLASSTNGVALYASANGSDAVYGFTNGGGGGDGVHGVSFAEGYGVYGYGNSGQAGYFSGDVIVTGTCCASAQGTFKIDHPLDPEKKYLNHATVASADMKDLYDGVVTLDGNGEAVVQLPDWFGALNSDFRYGFAPIGAPMPNLYIAQEIENNSFKIAGGKPGGKVSWQVTGIRKDAYAQAHPLQVEAPKPSEEQGTYLHPEEAGQPANKGIDYEKNQPMNPLP